MNYNVLRHIGTIAPALIVGAFGLTTYISIEREREAVHADEDSNRTIHAYDVLIEDVRAAQTGVRGFVITGNDRYLDPYRAAAERLPVHQKRLHELVRDEPRELAYVQQVDSLLDQLLPRFRQLIDLRERGGRQAAETEFRTGASDRLARQIDGVARAALVLEERQLQDLSKSQAKRAAVARIIIPLGAIIAALLCLAVNLLIARVMRSEARRIEELKDANSRLREQQAQLEHTAIELEESGEALASSEKRYRTIAQNSPDVIYRARFQPELSFDYMSPAVTRLLGVTPEQVCADANALLRLMHPEDRAQLLKGPGETFASGRRIVLRFIRNGETIWTEHRVHPIRGENGVIVAADGVARDVSLQRHYETELRAREGTLRALVENAFDLVFVVDANGNTSFISPSVERMLGYRPEDLEGVNMLSLVHPDDYLTAHEVRMKARNAPGERFETTIRVQAKDQTWRVLSYSLVNLLDHPGVRGMVVNARDITDSRRLEDQLRQAQKMEAIGRLAGGIAHDFNNLLTAIKGYTSFALQQLKGHPVYEDLVEVDAATERATSLTRQLLAFSRQQELRPTVVDVNEIVESFLRMVRRMIGEDIKVHIALADTRQLVKVDAAQLQQVLMNLFVNARDAMPKGGVISIDVKREIREATWPGTTPLPPGEYVMIAVTDNGLGMPADVRARAFEPFFTTKETGKGTGLGLSTVYGIVKQSGGNVYLYSEPDIGTTFKIYLPATEELKPRLPYNDAADISGDETVLVVEDEPSVRALAARALSSHGYHVVEARNGAEALSVMRSNDDIQLVLSDVIMPEMRGQELVEHVRREFPDMCIVLMSGYIETHVQGLPKDVAYIDKPFTIRSLVCRVRETLDAA